MATSSKIITSTPTGTEGLRLRLFDGAGPDRVDGMWWPRSRDLQREAADLVDHFPIVSGRISRMLFSRPDWDNSSTNGRGVRAIRAARGPVKVGSFPSDDTHLMILTMGSGQRLKLLVIPSDTPEDEAKEKLSAAAQPSTTRDSATFAGEAVEWTYRDSENPAG
jgi:hypothetical protein